MNIFDPKNQKRVKVIMGVIAIIVILGMVLLYAPFLGGGAY
jgi:predicted nucleic acid-binding Zn ribbon protein